MVVKKCFFIGYRETPDEVFKVLEAVVERHIVEYGVTEFIVGRYGRFDSLAARAVLAVKSRHPEVHLSLLLPYYSDQPVSVKGYDEIFYPPDMETVPKRLAIVRANRYMVDHSDYLIAFPWYSAGNSRKLTEYAQKREERGLIKVTLIEI